MITATDQEDAKKYLKNPTNIIPLIDLTSLNTDDNETSIIELCKKAITPFGEVAAVCIYPKFVNLAVNTLNKKSIKIATVINFPTGNASLFETLHEIESALNSGANEIDMVFPYHTYIRGEKTEALNFVVKARELCRNNIKLKIIIETGELLSPDLIRDISAEVIHSGADFIKTSTGKTKQGASIEAATAILSTIKEHAISKGLSVGIKISGGIRTISEAQSYIELACKVMGNSWVHPNVFRIGASKLLDEILTIAQQK